MRKNLFAICAIAALAMSACVAQAQQSGSLSSAQTQVGVNTGASAGVIINNTGQPAGEANRTYSEIRTAPALGSLALGGGHPCAFSPQTFQFSIVGGGAGVGGMQVDEACMLMVMGAGGDARAYQAALYMIAARDPDACVAMNSAGLVGECVNRRGNVIRDRVTTRPAQQPVAASTRNVQPSFTRCALDENNAIRVAVRRGATQEVAVSECKASLGF